MDLGAGDDTLTLSGGSIGSGITVSGGADSDTIALTGSTAFSFAGGTLTNFEVLTMANTATVTQSGAFTAQVFTLSAGTYSVSGTLNFLDLTLAGGELTGSGTVSGSAGAETFAWRGGTVSIAIDLGADNDSVTLTGSGGTFGMGGSVAGGAGSDTLNIQPASGATISFGGSGFTGFETLAKTEAGTAEQSSGTLVVDSVTISAGSYNIASGARLEFTSLTISGTGALGGAGTAAFAMGDNTFTFSGGTLSGVVDLGTGLDTFEFTGGTLTGTVNLGADADTFNFSGGTLSGTVNLGADVDTFNFSGGTLSGTVDLGAGADVFNFTGGTLTSTGTINFGDDDDVFTWGIGSSISSGTISGGAGTDTIVFALNPTADFTQTANLTINYDPSALEDFDKILLSTVFVGSIGYIITVNQSGTLDLGANGVLDVVIGDYIVQSGATVITDTLIAGFFAIVGGPGTVNFGDGDNTFKLEGGIVGPTGVTPMPGETLLTLNMGAGADTATLDYGELYSNLELGAGDDTLVLLTHSASVLKGTATVSGGSGTGGTADTDTIELSASGDVTFDGSKFTNFEKVSKTNTTTVKQTGTLNLGSSGNLVISAGTYTLGTGAGLVTGSVTLDGGTLSFTGTLDMGSGANQFIFNAGALSSGSMVSGGGGRDTLKLGGSSDLLSLLGGRFTNFEILEKSGSGTVTQSGSLNLGSEGMATISGGTYVISAGATLQTLRSLSLSNTILTVTGTLTFASGVNTLAINASRVNATLDLGAGDDSLTLSGQIVTVSATVSGGAGSDTINLVGTASFDGAKFTDFEVLEQTTGTGRVIQEGILNLGASGAVTISAGSYNVDGSGSPSFAARLLANSLTLTDAKLAGTGRVVLSDNPSTFNMNGSLYLQVDMGGSADTLTLGANNEFDAGGGGATGSIVGGGGIDTIAFASGTFEFDASKITGFENLTLSVSGSSVTQSGILDLGASGTATISAGSYGMHTSGGQKLTVSSLTLSGGTLRHMRLDDTSTSMTLSGGMVTGFVYLDDGVDSLTLSGGTIATTGYIHGGAGTDTIAFGGSSSLAIDGDLLLGFETLTKTGSITVTQEGQLDLGVDGSATITAGTYIIGSRAGTKAALIGNSLTINGGMLEGFGSVNLGFTLRGTQVTPDLSGLPYTAGTLTLSSGTLSLPVFFGIAEYNRDSVDDTFTMSGGALADNVYMLGGSDTFTWSGGSITGNVYLGSGDDSVTWSGGSFGAIKASGTAISGGYGSDSLVFDGSTAFSIDADRFLDFEAVTKNNTNTVTQATDWDLGIGTSMTITDGTYSIASGKKLSVGELTVEGGTLSGAGSVVVASTRTITVPDVVNRFGELIVGREVTSFEDGTFTLSGGTVSLAVSFGGGSDTFNLSGGSITSAVNLGGGDDKLVWSGGTFATIDFGAGVDTIELAASGALTLTAANVSNFELIVVSGSGTVTQVGTVDIVSDGILSEIAGAENYIGEPGNFIMNAGTYSIGTGNELKATFVTLTGGTLTGAGAISFGTGTDVLTVTWRHAVGECGFGIRIRSVSMERW